MLKSDEVNGPFFLLQTVTSLVKEAAVKRVPKAVKPVRQVTL